MSIGVPKKEQLLNFIALQERLYDKLFTSKFSFKILRYGYGVLAWEYCSDKSVRPRQALAVVNSMIPTVDLPRLDEDDWGSMFIFTDASLERWNAHMEELQKLYPDAVLEEFFYIQDVREYEDTVWDRMFGI